MERGQHRRWVVSQLICEGRRDKNASHFEPSTVRTLEGVEIPNVTLRLCAEQTHFALAVWAED